jgi:hypothetical protein
VLLSAWDEFLGPGRPGRFESLSGREAPDPLGPLRSSVVRSCLSFRFASVCIVPFSLPCFCIVC